MKMKIKQITVFLHPMLTLNKDFHSEKNSHRSAPYSKALHSYLFKFNHVINAAMIALLVKNYLATIKS